VGILTLRNSDNDQSDGDDENIYESDSLLACVAGGCDEGILP
jgi:hypothetical protein